VNLLILLSRRWILFTLLVVAGAAACARLGVWQLDRLKQRRAFNAHVLAVQAMPALKLPAEATAEDLPDQQYRPAAATGTYDFANQVALRNQYSNGQVGYHLLTPLVMKNGEAVLVDRGWIPADGNDVPAAWRKYDVPGEVTVNGVIQASQTASVFMGPTDPTLTPGQKGLDLWVFVNLQRIAQQMPYPVLPVYLQQNPVPNQTNPPIPLQVELDLSEGPHQSYAIQWFSFAALLLVGYPFYVRRQETPKK
jgi:surfeit locus 1 family protein